MTARANRRLPVSLVLVVVCLLAGPVGSVQPVSAAGYTGQMPVRASTSATGNGLRAGARKAVPVTRGQELGLRFRPDEDATVYPPSSQVPGGVHGDGDAAAQFRPIPKRKKPTYEELQAEQHYEQPAPPPMPYPLMPTPPLPGAGGYPPYW